MEKGIVALEVGYSRTVVEGRGAVIIHAAKLELQTNRCKSMTAEADSIKSLIKVEEHGSCWSWFY